MNKFIKIKHYRINTDHILAYEPRIIEAGFCEEGQKSFPAKYSLIITYPYTDSEPRNDFNGNFIFNDFTTCGETFELETEEELKSIISTLDKMLLI